jgi:hypothetical protein
MTSLGTEHVTLRVAEQPLIQLYYHTPIHTHTHTYFPSQNCNIYVPRVPHTLEQFNANVLNSIILIKIPKNEINCLKQKRSEFGNGLK